MELTQGMELAQVLKLSPGLLQSMEMLLLQNAIWSKKKDFVRGRKIMDVVVGVGGHS